MNKQYTEKLNNDDLERINEIICKRTEANLFLDMAQIGKSKEYLYEMFYEWVGSAMGYVRPLQLIKNGRVALDVALEYLKENDRKGEL